MDGVLWDMDGLLVDTEPVWTAAEVELAALLGGTWTDEIKARIVGTRLDVAVPAILQYYGVADTPAQVAETSSWLLNRMVELFAHSLHVMPGARRLHAALRAAGVPQALVSSSYRVLVDAVLAQDLARFDVTVAGDEVARGKPDAEPYLTAARALGVDPRRCVVLEDSPAGLASGEAAGCAVVAVPSVHGVTAEPTERRLVVASLAELDVRSLTELVAQPPAA
jgi:HAD superfamily hydrolase (TIGR01509 family)